MMRRFSPLLILVALLSGRLAKGLPAAVAEDAIQHTVASYSRTLDHCVLSHDLTPALRALPLVPLLALHGDDDPAAPLPVVQALARQMPAITLRILAEKHHIFLTQHTACLTAIQSYLTAMQSNEVGA